ncbi:hypothetical protein VIOR103205_09030 [Vibrio ordalii]|uniref:hypothetical protein n=1 Tax=Vibrio ordalii TaxID=28174 RepID=UPI00024835BF|nr:hypothetical protein [Vibrio ordalii]
MKIKKQYLKGQVFLKYLWQHSFYKRGETGVSPVLAKDIKAIALSQQWIEPTKNLDNAAVFHWITDSVIPKWVRLSSFCLAVRHGWQPVDYVDVMSVLYLNTETLSKNGIEKTLDMYRQSYGLAFPQAVVKRIIIDNEC